jgi:tetratricopeptide (TPR) repeat protein
MVLAAAASAQPDKAKKLNDLGLAALAAGNYSQADENLSEALRIWRSLGPDFEYHSSIGMINLGDVYCSRGQWKEGQKLFQDALAMQRRLVGSKNLLTLANINRVANVHLIQGEFDLAEPLYLEAMAIERELYPSDIQTAHTLAGLGSLYERMNKFDQALPYSEEALEITLRATGDASTETGLAYANVGQIHRMARRTDRAIPLLRKSMSILEHSLGPEHPRVGSVESQLGVALMEEGKLKLAEVELTRAVKILSQPRGTNVELGVAEHNLGWLRVQQKKYADADRLLSNALALEEEYSVKPTGEMASTLEMLSTVREKENRPEEAAKLRSRASMIMTLR